MRTRWTEENWLKLMQVYLKKPAGVKPLYSRDIVNLALELHFSPQSLYRRMVSLTIPASSSGSRWMLNCNSLYSP